MKQLSRARLLVLAFALVPSSSSALAAPRVARAQEALPSAREIVDRFAAVTHLEESLEKTSSMHVKGSFAMEAMGLKGAAEIWSAKPNRRYVSMEMGPFGTVVTGFDGQTAWMTHPMMGARILAGTEFLQAKLEASYDEKLKTKGYDSLTTLGREAFEGKECYKVEVVARPLEGMDVESTRAVRTSLEYYEIASGLLIGSSGRQEGELGGGPFTQVFSDYRDFSGALMPVKTMVRQSGQEIVLTLERVEFDTATEATFGLPVEIQKLVEAGTAKPATPKAQ